MQDQEKKVWGASWVIAIPALLSIVTFIIYYSTLWYGFIFDDLPTITQNFHNRVIDISGYLFQKGRFLSRILNQITFVKWGANPFAYRIVDVLMHIAIGIMIFAILYRVLSRAKKTLFLSDNALALSTITMMLFLLHPLQTQTVTYITQMRLEGLVALLSMATVMTFVFAATTYQQSTCMWMYIFSFVFAAFSIGTKEIVLVLPALLILVDWFLISQGEWLLFKTRLWAHGTYMFVVWGLLFRLGILAPHYVTTIASTPLHNNRGNILTATSGEMITWYQWVISQGKVIWHYITVFVWPSDLSFDYDMKLSSHIYSLDVIVPFLGLIALAWGLYKLFRRFNGDPIVFGFLWFFVGMLPRTSFIPSTELVCDYKTYTSSFGMMFVLAYVIWWALTTLVKHWPMMQTVKNYRLAAVVLFALSCLGLCVSTKSRNFVWSNEVEFWLDVSKKAPKSRVFNNLGTGYWEQGKSKEAIECFNEAIKRDDFYAEPHVNLASIYQLAGDRDKAMDHYRRAIEIGEAHPELYNNLGILHFTEKNYATAELCFKQAIELKPYYSRSLCFLGKVYTIQGKVAEANDCYERALAGDAPDMETYYLHGSLNFDLGRYDKAIASLQNVKPDFMNTAFMLGSAFYSVNNYKKAIEYFEIAHKVNPTDFVCTYNYAQTLLNLGRYQEALPLYQECLPHQDVCPFTPLHRIKCLYHIGLKDEAQKSLKVLIGLTKNQPVKLDAMLLGRELKLL
jgi:tetratricopeptide (TPR) repeat protein